MGRGHKQRRLERRAREMQEHHKNEQLEKDILQEDNEEDCKENLALRKHNDEQVNNEKSIEICIARLFIL